MISSIVQMKAKCGRSLLWGMLERRIQWNESWGTNTIFLDRKWFN